MRLALVLFLASCRFGFADHTAVDASVASADVAAFAPDVTPPDPVADAQVEPTPYAYFSMDGDPSQGLFSTNPAFAGTCTSCPTVTTGHLGNGIAFDSTNSVTMSFQVGTQPYTIATWFSTGGQGTLLAQPLDDVSVDNVVNIAVNSNNDLVFETFDGSQPAYLESAGVTIIGGWHHVAITWDGTTKALYIDGALANSASAVLVDANRALVLGTDIDVGVPAVPYTGALDELRFYAVALDAAHIAALAN